MPNQKRFFPTLLFSSYLALLHLALLSSSCSAFHVPFTQKLSSTDRCWVGPEASSCHSQRQPLQRRGKTLSRLARNKKRSSDDYFDDEDDVGAYDGAYYDENNDYDDDDDFFTSRFAQRTSRRRPRRDDLGGSYDANSGLNLPSAFGRRDGWRLPEAVSKSLLAGIFILGVGLGVTIDSQVNTNPRDLASRDAIDQAAPNPTLCAKLGASAMAFDQRVFVSFNPFNVYVSQADVKPACVLRDANVVPVLRSRGLISDEEVRACKNNMNTWAYVGDLDSIPQLSCVYKSQDAQNEFLSNPKLGIGEDYLDDDRERLKQLKSTGKIVKGSMTEAQKELLRKQANSMPVVNDV